MMGFRPAEFGTREVCLDLITGPSIAMAVVFTGNHMSVAVSADVEAVLQEGGEGTVREGNSAVNFLTLVSRA